MKRIIDGKVYNTETAEALLYEEWRTYHPNQGDGSPMLDHVEAVYRTKKGNLFGYQRHDRGYGRDRNGVTGLYTETSESIEPIVSAAHAVHWCVDGASSRFDPDEIEKHFGEALEEA